jgi:RNA 2',3'-cyclic 3'-phosphodiesterase
MTGPRGSGTPAAARPPQTGRLRAFFGLPVPEIVKPRLSEAITRMQQHARGSRLSPRWQPPEKLHITLKFLGWTDAEQLPALWAMGIERARTATPIQTELAAVTTFGPARRARVVIASVVDTDGGLGALAAGLEAGAEALGFEREAREFRAHVTLARLKNPGNVTDWLSAAAFEPVPVRFDELCLYRSDLTRDGGIYTVLERLRLND